GTIVLPPANLSLASRFPPLARAIRAGGLERYDMLRGRDAALVSYCRARSLYCPSVRDSLLFFGPRGCGLPEALRGQSLQHCCGPPQSRRPRERQGCSRLVQWSQVRANMPAWLDDHPIFAPAPPPVL